MLPVHSPPASICASRRGVTYRLVVTHACARVCSVGVHSPPGFGMPRAPQRSVIDLCAWCEPLPRCGLSATRAEGRGARLTHGLGVRAWMWADGRAVGCLGCAAWPVALGAYAAAARRSGGGALLFWVCPWIFLVVCLFGMHACILFGACARSPPSPLHHTQPPILWHCPVGCCAHRSLLHSAHTREAAQLVVSAATRGFSPRPAR